MVSDYEMKVRFCCNLRLLDYGIGPLLYRYCKLHYFHCHIVLSRSTRQVLAAIDNDGRTEIQSQNKVCVHMNLSQTIEIIIAMYCSGRIKVRMRFVLALDLGVAIFVDWAVRVAQW
jgi:hypothetical protein